MASLPNKFFSSPRLVPTLGMDPKPHKMPLHLRGRLLIAAVVVPWSLIGLGAALYFS